MLQPHAERTHSIGHATVRTTAAGAFPCASTGLRTVGIDAGCKGLNNPVSRVDSGGPESDRLPRTSRATPMTRDPSQSPGAATADLEATAPTRDRDGRTARDSTPGGRRGMVQLFPRPESAAPAAWVPSPLARVGRGRGCTVGLPDARISREHATVETQPRGLFVRDLGSRHGSFVNGVRVGPEGLAASDGAVVRFGDTLLIVADDVERHRAPPRRLRGADLGLAGDMIAGPALAAVWDQAARVARLSDPVLLLGETGSGKECVARIIHARSARPGPFVGLNMAAIPEPLFEAELFGYEKGAFTGAVAARPGAFREARDGVLFLDEIGELRLDLQAKLLRAMDLQRVRPLAAGRDVEVNARVVSATNRDLAAAAEAGQFRPDLRYRLSGLVLVIPPLRERREDVVLLAAQLLGEIDARLGLSADTAEALVLARWEGNVRQLRQVLVAAAERAVADGVNEILAAHLPDLDRAPAGGQGLTARQVQAAMTKADGVASRAAEILGVSRTTLYNTFKRLKLDGGSVRGR
jgi:DNA-binding NtrC family response regulator